MSHKKSQEERGQKERGQEVAAASPDAAAQTLQAQTLQVLKKKAYRKELTKLQVELFRLQEWIQGEGLRLVVILEGLGPSGKRGTARRIAEGLDQRVCRVVTPDLPNKRERHQWHFQRYVEEFPPAGRMVIFDGSWYHVPAMERALGLLAEHEFQDFLRHCAEFERTLAGSGITLVKYWFSAGDGTQEQRFREHVADLARHKRLGALERKPIASPASTPAVQGLVFEYTQVPEAPWHLVKADDRRRARLNCIHHLLSLVPGRAETQGRPIAEAGQAAEPVQPAAPVEEAGAIPEVY